MFVSGQRHFRRGESELTAEDAAKQGPAPEKFTAPHGIFDGNEVAGFRRAQAIKAAFFRNGLARGEQPETELLAGNWRRSLHDLFRPQEHQFSVGN